MVKHIFLGAALLVAAATIPAMAVHDDGTDRPGSDYQTITVDAWERCMGACLRDAQCRAWSFTLRGQAANNCRLKSERPQPRPNPCCISGEVEQ